MIERFEKLWLLAARNGRLMRAQRALNRELKISDDTAEMIRMAPYYEMELFGTLEELDLGDSVTLSMKPVWQTFKGYDENDGFIGEMMLPVDERDYKVGFGKTFVISEDTFESMAFLKKACDEKSQVEIISKEHKDFSEVTIVVENDGKEFHLRTSN